MAEGLSNREVGFLIGGLTIGLGVGYFSGVKMMETKFEAKVEELELEYSSDVKAIRNEYERAKLNWEKPELKTVVTELGYSSAEQTAIDEVEEEVKSETRNVFEHSMEDEEWDYQEEIEKRAKLDPGVPYIIHREEFFENPDEYSQTTITYYAGDDVLADERDQVLEPRDHIVGAENLKQMGTGHGSGDPNVLYIRNDRTDCDFEVINNPGKFSEEAMGFIEHSFEPRRRRLHFDDE